MSLADSLPTSLEELRAFALAALAERDAAIAERDEARAEIEKIRHLLKRYANGQYGPKSEKLDPDQLKLALEDMEQALAKSEAIDEKKTKTPARPRKANRGALPAHLPRIHVTLAPKETTCRCCQQPMHMIEDETSSRLDVIPAQLRVIVTHRPKFACRACERIVQEVAPERLIKSGIPTEAMVAHVLVAKYGWHLPLYRQAQIYSAQGVKLDRSTLAFWVGYAAAELMPIWQRLRDAVLSSPKLAVDETHVPVLDPGRGCTKTGYFWTMARDDRSWRGTDPPAVVYSYAPGRGKDHGLDLLANYVGIVQCDGYAVYKALDRSRITLAFCWSHLRRKFHDLAKGGDAPVADEALVRIAGLYAVEATIRGKSAAERQGVRQEKTAPLVASLRHWFEDQLARVSATSLTAEALRYGLNHWDGLIRFLDDGRIELDTNIVERTMRPVSLSRKNSLFAGHDDGAENWACIASLIETCKLHDINPETYLSDVLTKLVNLWPMERIDDLLPWAWKQHADQSGAASVPATSLASLVSA
jgi:transposase